MIDSVGREIWCEIQGKPLRKIKLRFNLTADYRLRVGGIEADLETLDYQGASRQADYETATTGLPEAVGPPRLSTLSVVCRGLRPLPGTAGDTMGRCA